MTIDEIIQLALQEDIPFIDITTDNLGVDFHFGRAQLKAKQDLVISGQEFFEKTVKAVDPKAQVIWFFKDGQTVLKGQNACTIDGDLLKVLKAERVALNFIGRLSGIATLTRMYVEEVMHTKTKILDTRKTTPLYRSYEKKAVLDGGGDNHRKSLSDMIMLKDNHIALMNGIQNAVVQIRKKTNQPLIVEASSLTDVSACVTLKVDRILLDNMNNEELKAALAIIPESIQTEASGNMNLARVRSVAELGVDFISIGALTHSAPVADFSLLFDWF